MLIQLLLEVIVGLIELLIGALPALSVPAWLVGAGPMVSDLVSRTGAFSHWVPIGLLLTVASAVLACIAAGFAIRSVRMVLSFFTGGGGS
jgi:hypothetical protein